MCEKKFSLAQYLKAHERTHEKVEKIKCLYCPKTFATKCYWKDHMRSHNEELKLPCSICHKTFTLAHSLKGHMKLHTENGGKRFNCDNCSKSFPSSTHLTLHNRRVHLKEKNVSCRFCHKTLFNKLGLEKHEAIHTRGNYIKCSLCDERFEYKHSLKKNVLTAHTTIKCDICDKEFSGYNKLNHHLKIHGEKTFFCSFCSKGFFYRNSLKRHESFHTAERNIDCHYCERKFTHQQHLKAHIKSVHNPAKKFWCSECRKSFTNTEQLKSHRETHKVTCSFCNKIMLGQNIKKHVHEVHMKEKRFSCSVCLKSFSQKSNLKAHIELHHGNLNSRCKYCERFVLKGELKRHQSIHEGDTVFLCEICQIPFAKKATLITHRKTHQQNVASISSGFIIE